MKHDIEFFEDEHLYLVDGEEVPSVTTILNYMSDVEYSKVSPAVLEQAARRGSLVHEYTELIDYGCEPDEVEYEVVGYLKAYKDFLRDYKPDWLFVEEPLYSEEYGYAGTVDRIGYINGELSVVDIKTLASPTKMQKFTVSAQTMAYEVAYGEYVGKRYALYLGKDGEYNLVDLWEYDTKYSYNSWEMFRICLYTYKTVQELKTLKPIKKGEKG